VTVQLCTPTPSIVHTRALQEDASLREQVSLHGPQNWSHVAKALKGRNGKSCRLRCAQPAPCYIITARTHWCGDSGVW
jgi:hypothetical protein